MKLRCLLLAAWLPLVGAARAADSTVEVTKQPPPQDAVSAEVAAALAPSAFKVVVEGKAVCEIWLAKQWPAKPQFAPTPSLLYPLEVGELIGVIRFPADAGDFREQPIPAGVYTLRYGQQPEDGNHVGTSDTRDFLVVVPAKKDTKAARLGMDQMFQLSTEVTQTTHPAILSMLAADKGGKLPAIRHDAARELWSVRVQGSALAGQQASELPLEFVVVGHFKE
jgi:hypothetical protein